MTDGGWYFFTYLLLIVLMGLASLVCDPRDRNDHSIAERFVDWMKVTFNRRRDL